MQREHRFWRRRGNMEFLLLEKHFIQLHPGRCSSRLYHSCFHFVTPIGEYQFFPPRTRREGNLFLKLKWDKALFIIF